MPESTTLAIDVALDDVSKSYGTGAQSFAALSNVTLHVVGGEFVAITGPSGSGKTTLLNLIGGLDTPSAGRVTIGGEDLAALSDDARSDRRLCGMGFVFQSFNLFPTFTVVENVAWPLEFLGASWREARERAITALARVGIDAAAQTRRPAELSGGEQQRVAIARALVTRPGLLLADEPTGNLDSRSGGLVLDLLDGLRTDRRLTIIVVTHSALVADRADRTIELCDGRLVHASENSAATEAKKGLVR